MVGDEGGDGARDLVGQGLRGVLEIRNSSLAFSSVSFISIFHHAGDLAGQGLRGRPCGQSRITLQGDLLYNIN